MDYEKMWISLKEHFERAIKEGSERGFHFPKRSVNHGEFIAYARVLKKMREMEGVQNESN